MQAGKLDTRITIERKATTSDADTGRDVVTWQSIVAAPGKLWAEVMDILPSRDEAQRAGVEIGVRRTRVRIRYRSDIDASMRVVVHRDVETVYQIVGGPSILGRKEGIELLCERTTT